MNDIEFDERLRTGLRSLTEAAGPAPRISKVAASPGGWASRGWWPSLAAAAAVVTVLVAGLFVLDRSPESTTSSNQDGAELLGTWTLTAAVLDGAELEVGPTSRDWTFIADRDCTRTFSPCTPGPIVVGRDACNSFERTASFSPDRITWGDETQSTLVGCSGPLTDAFGELAMAEVVDYVIIDEVLTLSAGAARLTFVWSGAPLEPPDALPDPAPPTISLPETIPVLVTSGTTALPTEDAVDADHFVVDGVAVAVTTELPELPELATTIRDGGTIIDDGDGPRMCMGVVDESYPPQCDGPVVDGLDMGGWAETVAGVTFGERTIDVSWPPVDDHVTLIRQQTFEPVTPPEPPTLEPASFSEAELQAAQDAIVPMMAGGELYIGSFGWGDATNRITVDLMVADQVTVRALAQLVDDPDMLVVIGIAEILDGS